MFPLEAILFFFGMFLSAYLCWYSYQRLETQGAWYFSMMTAGMAFWLFCSGIDLLPLDPFWTLFWKSVKFVGACGTTIMSVMLAVALSNRDGQVPTWLWRTCMIWMVGVVLLVWTNPFHGLFWESISRPAERLESLTVKGSLFPIYAVVSLSAIVATVVLYLIQLIQVQPFYRTRYVVIMFGSAIPFLVHFMNESGYPLVPGVDQIPLSLAITALVLAIGIFRFQMLDVLRVAQGLVIDSIEAGVLVIDSDRKILGANPFAKRVISNANSQMSLEDIAPNLAQLPLVHGTDHEYYPENPRFDDECYLAKITHVKHESVGRLGYAFILVDISERKRAERKTMEAMESRARFFAAMSHELRTPLHGISGLLELLRRTDLSFEQEELLRKTNSSSQVLLTQINEVLEFSRLQFGDYQFDSTPFELKRVVENVRSFATVLAKEKGLTLNCEVPALDRQLIGDPLRLTQVLTNLVGNALKFTENGTILLRVKLVSDDANAVRVRFSIADSGVGIAEDRREAIFQAFTQNDGSTSRHFGGTGLGLTISNQLVQGMGGQLKVKSQLSRWSVFGFELAFAKGGELEEYVSPEYTELVPLKGKVLLVDDSPINQEVAVALLESYGLGVSVAGNGTEAVAKVAEELPDLVLMDVHMPGMDGHEATKQILSVHPELPIVAMTASAFDEDRKQALAAGMCDFIAKPFAERELYDVVARVMRQGQITSEPSAGVRSHTTDTMAVLSLSGMLATKNPSKHRSMVKEFIIELRSELDELNESAELPKWEEFVHGVKGSAGLLGAQELSAMAGNIYRELSSGTFDPQSSAVLIKEAVARLEATADALEAYRLSATVMS